MQRESIEFFSPANQPLKPGSHFIVFDEFAAVRLRYSALNGRYKACLVFQHPLNSIFYELLGVFSGGDRHLLQARLHIRREVNFHAPIMPLPVLATPAPRR